jgi:transposase
MAGCRTWAAAREKLAGDRAERCRLALDLDRPRRRVGKNTRYRVSRDGVPAERTMGRHLRLWGMDRHALAYRELFAAMADCHFEEFPDEMAAELRLVDWDGSAILCHRSSFERKRTLTDRRGRKREVSTPTLAGGGFRPRTQDNAGKDGHGFALHAGITSTGLPLVADITAINAPEGRQAARLLREDWQQRIAGRVGLTEEQFGVMAFDAAYSGADVRTAVHDSGYVPNCHPVSHADRERSKENARAHNKLKFAIEGKPGWGANGHREVFCRHGVQATKKLFRRKKGGVA